jgi:hypothetical protein
LYCENTISCLFGILLYMKLHHHFLGAVAFLLLAGCFVSVPKTAYAVAPTVSSFTPADNATGVHPRANLVIEFSNPVTIGTGNIVLKRASDDSTVETFSVTSTRVSGEGTDTITIDPTASLAGSSEYYVLIDATAFEDGDDNFYTGISSPTVWNFTTAVVNEISTCEQLQAMNGAPTAHYILTQDIQCAHSVTWNDGAGFTPIGLPTYFSGSLNGNGYTIRNVYINLNAGTLGLFRFLTGTVHNLGLVNVDITGTSGYVGALAGALLNGGVIEQVFVTGTVTGTAYNGGLIGRTEFGNVRDVYSRVVVNGTALNGGLVGLPTNDTPFTNAYATGSVNSGSPSGMMGHLGSGVFTNLFYDSQTTGASDDVGKGKPKTTVQMKNVATYTDTETAGLTSAWDFVGNPNDDTGNEDIWDIDPEINDGYPFFSWQAFDTTAPTVQTLSPSDDAEDVEVNANLVVTFTEPVVVGTGNISLYKTVGDVLVETIAVGSDKVTGVGTNTITINPTADLENAVQYYVRIDATAFEDTWANYFAGILDSTTWSFTTVAIPEPVPAPIVRAPAGAVPLHVLAEINKQIAIENEANMLKRAEETPVIQTTRVPVFTRNLSIRMRGVDVSNLQEFLVARNTGPAAQVLARTPRTQYFGVLTRNAVIEFQKANKISPAVGNFGIITRSFVNTAIGSLE